MSKKMYVLVSTLVTCVFGAAAAIVTYMGVKDATIINSALGVAEGAIITICGLFTEGGAPAEKK